ncbi:MAG: rhomboid family intramembrane serine protease [Sulfitobacter sp.]
MQDPDFQPPVNPLPPVVVILFLALAGVEAALSLAEAGLIGGRGGIGWRLSWVRDWGFSAGVFQQMWAIGSWPLDQVARIVSYSFIHWSFGSSVFGAVLLLALGKMVGETMGQIAVAVLFFASGITGALVYALLASPEGMLVGAYPNVYGLIGGYTFVMWRSLGAAGAAQLQAFSLIGFLMGLQLLWSLLFGAGDQWIAELAGFICGFGLSFVLVPGGWTHLVAQIRRR